MQFGGASKWELDHSEVGLGKIWTRKNQKFWNWPFSITARLDGTNKPLKHQTMEDYLQLEGFLDEPAPTGKKRVNLNFFFVPEDIKFKTKSIAGALGWYRRKTGSTQNAGDWICGRTNRLETNDGSHARRKRFNPNKVHRTGSEALKYHIEFF